MKKALIVILCLALVVLVVYKITGPNYTAVDIEADYEKYSSYTAVAEYIHTYNKLPGNYLTKSAAQSLGWDSGSGNLWKVTDHMSIGGDTFFNREGLLPEAPGRTWKECDVNYNGGFRGAERLVYSNDGLIYYTKDHYASFIRLY